jgi:hypothetical protein
MHKVVVALSMAAVSVVFTPAVASADAVGVPGTPNCFGQRVSHGSSDHGLTPKERAAGLQELVDSGFPPAVELFGETVSVREFADFVRTNCSDEPYVE